MGMDTHSLVFKRLRGILCVVVFGLFLAFDLDDVFAANYQSDNFIVTASDAAFARQIAMQAEEYRARLSTEWLGAPMRRWARPCVVTVTDGPDVPPGGDTVFKFSDGEVYDWKMRLQGSRERILDSVLPHEVTHTILATYLRSPAPRWIDEGMATSVEADVEKNRYRTMLATFLHTRRGVAFNDMVAMKEYPKDLIPFYSQSFSVCEYLILVGGRRRLVEFAKYAVETGDWNAALRKYYACPSLGDLQKEWVAWIKEWDVANQPAELPRTRTLPAFVEEEPRAALAMNQKAAPSNDRRGLLNWGRSEENDGMIARGQGVEKTSGGFFTGGLSQVFGGKSTRANESPRGSEMESSRASSATDRRATQPARAGSRSSNAPYSRSIRQSTNTVLSNGAGSAVPYEYSNAGRYN